MSYTYFFYEYIKLSTRNGFNLASTHSLKDSADQLSVALLNRVVHCMYINVCTNQSFIQDFLFGVGEGGGEMKILLK